MNMKNLRIILGAMVLAGGVASPHLGQILPEYPAMAPGMLSIWLCALSLLITGYDVLWRALKNILRGAVFDEHFLMSVASIAAFVIGEYPEAAAVMLFYQIGEYFQDYAVDKSRRSIAALTAIRPDRAFVVRDGKVREVPPEDVAVGEYIEVRPGERLPLDGVVAEGVSFLDTSALTGESVPREVLPGSEALAGSVNTLGLLRLQVTRCAGDSAVSRILRLVEEAGNKKAKTERFITRFARVYTPIVTVSAFLLAVIPPLLLGGGAAWGEWVRRGVIFLVVSCPCALVISVPLGFFGGIGAASRQGILIKGGNYLELLARTSVVVFDKTGTLTKGVFNVSAVHPAQGGVSEAELLALAAHAEKFSCHPISCSLRTAHSGSCCDCVRLTGAREISGKGVSITVDGEAVLAGNSALLRDEGVSGIAEECAASDGGTIVHVAAGGTYSGHIVISDELKADARRTIQELKAAGIKKTVMLTGDTQSAGQKAAADLGVDEVYAGLLPADKVAQVERLLAEEQTGGKRGTVAFLGDGINDAPVLARSDVGVAMGGLGSDAAIEAADVVIMSDEPSRLAKGIKIARKTMVVVRQNIVFSLGIKGAALVLGAAGIASMWLAVFADVGVTFLAVLNSLRLLAGSPIFAGFSSERR
ncbi:MAG: cadmium-translocating P-type ATPase [Treponema sp.]|jgi:Cd2+/Zn2+-exporting ATPase|nr:cadmium-translocating P-type ATPase [Treponema sp.]